MDDEEKIARHCWSSEGLWGNYTCPELDKHVSCLNCPTYIGASQRLYGRKVPDEYLLSGKIAFEKKEAATPSGSVCMLVFSCAGMYFAFAASAVSEISRHKMLHRIPHRLDSAIEGIVNINGELIVAIAILRVLGLSSSCVGESENSAIIVCRNKSERFAFRVDSLVGIRFFQHGDGILPPEGDSKFVERIFNIDGTSIKFLDFELLGEAVLKNRI